MRLGLLAAALLFGCGSTASSTGAPPAPPFTACEIGQLGGAWLVSYTEVDGNCGPVPDETVVAPSGAPMKVGGGVDAGGPQCTIAAQTISADKCEIDDDFTCTLLGGTAGTQHWSGALHQTSAVDIVGRVSLQLLEPMAACRSTYIEEWKRQ